MRPSVYHSFSIAQLELRPMLDPAGNSVPGLSLRIWNRSRDQEDPFFKTSLIDQIKITALHPNGQLLEESPSFDLVSIRDGLGRDCRGLWIPSSDGEIEGRTEGNAATYFRNSEVDGTLWTELTGIYDERNIGDPSMELLRLQSDIRFSSSLPTATLFHYLLGPVKFELSLDKTIEALRIDLRVNYIGGNNGDPITPSSRSPYYESHLFGVQVYPT